MFASIRKRSLSRAAGVQAKVPRYRFAGAFVALALLLIAIAPAAYAQSGAIRIVSDSNSNAEYRVFKIATVEGLPSDQAFDWAGLSGVTPPPGTDRPYPSYDPVAPDAAAQGRALVENVSEGVAHDEDGSLALWLSGHLRQGAAPVATVRADGPMVNVDNGWYLLISTGKRPLFAWVEGAPVTLGDKSDAPVLTKQVVVDGKPGDHVVAGGANSISYRLAVTVPATVELYTAYPLAIHDAWDSMLQPAGGKVSLSLSGEHGERDVTSLAQIAMSDRALDVSIDLIAAGAKPGDVLEVAYALRFANDAKPGSTGAVNEAYVTFPSHDGAGKTPEQTVRAYAVRGAISLVDGSGDPLADGRFAVRSKDGRWLAQDGSFGSEDERGVWATDADGRTPLLPAFVPGEYEIVQIEAPKGYAMPRGGVYPFTLVATAEDGRLHIELSIADPCTVLDVDAQAGTYVLQAVNTKQLIPGLPGFMPQTGDVPWMLAMGGLLVAGIALILIGARVRNGRRG